MRHFTDLRHVTDLRNFRFDTKDCKNSEAKDGIRSGSLFQKMERKKVKSGQEGVEKNRGKKSLTIGSVKFLGSVKLPGSFEEKRKHKIWSIVEVHDTYLWYQMVLTMTKRRKSRTIFRDKDPWVTKENLCSLISTCNKWDQTKGSEEDGDLSLIIVSLIIVSLTREAPLFIHTST